MNQLAAALEAQSIPEPNTGCWLWTGYVKPTGYGSTKRDGRTISAHRAMYEAVYSEIPMGLDVCHRCDVRACINPRHLFLGTRAENLADMWRKGRGHRVRGEVHGRAKLTEADVRGIRASVAAGEKQGVVAIRFGVTHMTVNDIHHRRSWRYLKDEAGQ